ncbi:MAG: DUF3307 domain-containing protein [Anaerolineae bacterium]|jgi:hypothetical protein
MSLFDWLLVGHLVGDFLMQTERMAEGKVQSWPWMLKHIGLYMAVMTAVIGAYALAHPVSTWLVVLVLLFIAGTHIVLDRRHFTQGWMRLVGVSTDHPWMPTVVDQVFHVLVLAVAAQVLVMAAG